MSGIRCPSRCSMMVLRFSAHRERDLGEVCVDVFQDVPDRRLVVPQHSDAGAVGDNLDVNGFALVPEISRQIHGIGDRVLHRHDIVGIDLEHDLVGTRVKGLGQDSADAEDDDDHGGDRKPSPP